MSNRCDDLPIVFTHLKENKDSDYLTYGYVDDRLKFPFQPESICMVPSSGRVYHPASDKVGGVGLIKSSLAIELSQHFGYDEGADETVCSPTSFHWKGKVYKLNNEVVDKIEKLNDS